MTERTIRYVPLDEVEPAVRNPRLHSNLEDVKRSIRSSGFVESAVHDGRTGRIIAGHGRLQALTEMSLEGETAPDGIMVADGRWLMPLTYGWSSADDGEAERMVVWLNRAPEVGGWDDDQLVALLTDLKASDGGLVGSGYSDADLSAMVAELDRIRVREHDRAHAGDPDEIPPVPVEPVTRRGDVWLLGEHRLMCGDSRDGDDVAVLLAGAWVNVAFTSPPYADRRDYDETSGFRPVHPDQYVEWFAPVAKHVAAHLAESGSWFVVIKEHCEDGQRVLYVKDLVITHVRQWGWALVDELAWVKSGVPGRWENRFKNGWEPIFHFSAPGPIKFRPDSVAHPSDDVLRYSPDNPKTHSGFLSSGGGENGRITGMALPNNVLRINNARADVERGHTAEFPIELPAWFTLAYSDPGDVVYDPFVGSGSTILAAHIEGRRGYGMEISPAYCDVTAARFQRHTGTVPILEATGQPHSFVDEP